METKQQSVNLDASFFKNLTSHHAFQIDNKYYFFERSNKLTYEIDKPAFEILQHIYSFRNIAETYNKFEKVYGIDLISEVIEDINEINHKLLDSQDEEYGLNDDCKTHTCATNANKQLLLNTLRIRTDIESSFNSQRSYSIANLKNFLALHIKKDSKFFVLAFEGIDAKTNKQYILDQITWFKKIVSEWNIDLKILIDYNLDFDYSFLNNKDISLNLIIKASDLKSKSLLQEHKFLTDVSKESINHPVLLINDHINLEKIIDFIKSDTTKHIPLKIDMQNAYLLNILSDIKEIANLHFENLGSFRPGINLIDFKYHINTLHRLGNNPNCSSKLNEIIIDKNGNIFTDNEVIGIQEYCIGTIKNSLDNNKLNDLNIDNAKCTTKCSSCWLQDYCDVQKRQLSGIKNTNHICDFRKSLMEIFIHMYCKILENAPEMLPARIQDSQKFVIGDRFKATLINP